MKRLQMLVALLMISALSGVVPAQTYQGRILGSVTDEQGAAVRAAKVTITNVETGASRTVESNDAGDYVAPNLAPGLYSVVVEASGFKKAEHAQVRVEVASDVRIDVSLVAGNITESVTVTFETPEIDTTNTTLGGTFSNKSINDLPLNG
ncbi:MAG TPA: carboxypeptidase-like regulatory domain-containing protein, partial [Blastocatellia bacterium]|nr:carboxypeptidase-like regulatory domain-containing protein [Blastocatellia bacterium]